MTPLISVVIPALNAAGTLKECLHAMKHQSLDQSEYEVILVDGHSSDSTREIARKAGVRTLIQDGTGRAAARNTGYLAARGSWVAFTDADCIPTHTWLQYLLNAVSDDEGKSKIFGAAGKTTGYFSGSSAARYVDLTGGLDAERHLSHPNFPCAPTANLMYSKQALIDTQGFDDRYVSYAFCELHYRMIKLNFGEFVYVPQALVLHQHREGWKEYWNQQVDYGKGYAQFMLHHKEQIPWNFFKDLLSILRLLPMGAKALLTGSESEKLIRKGNLIKNTAQKIGFETVYWSREERRRWQQEN
jgi:glycosyltransferase involved in cell wall biosynthesis